MRMYIITYTLSHMHICVYIYICHIEVCGCLYACQSTVEYIHTDTGTCMRESEVGEPRASGPLVSESTRIEHFTGIESWVLVKGSNLIKVP